MVSWSAKGSILEAPGFEFEWFWDAPGQVLEGAGFIFDFFFQDLWAPHLEVDFGCLLRRPTFEIRAPAQCFVRF